MKFWLMVKTLKFLMISLKNYHMKEMTVKIDFNGRTAFRCCLVEDHVYVIYQNNSNAQLTIVSEDLKTWKAELIDRPNAPKVIFRDHLRVIAHGKDIFICFDDSTVSIFNTEAKEWTKVEDNFGRPNGQYYLQMVYGATIYVNEVFIFKFLPDPLLKNWTRVFNCNSMKWRRENISIPSIFNVMFFINCFAFKGKIFAIKNSNMVINRLCPENIELIDDQIFTRFRCDGYLRIGFESVVGKIVCN
ncbi:hypothetical protein CHUAL_014099 [Chamberlinius hualienensis]